MEWLLNNVFGEGAGAIMALIGALIGAFISLVSSIFATRSAKRTSATLTSAEYSAKQRVKSDTLELRAALFALVYKTFTWKEQINISEDELETGGLEKVPAQFHRAKLEGSITLKPEKDAISKFLHSTTFCAYLGYGNKVVRKDEKEIAQRFHGMIKFLLLLDIGKDVYETKDIAELQWEVTYALCALKHLAELLKNEDVFQGIVGFYEADVSKSVADWVSLGLFSEEVEKFGEQIGIKWQSY